MASEFFKQLKMEYIFFLARRLPACDELLPVMSQNMDSKLSWRQRFKLRLHLHICEACKRYANHLLLLRQAMRNQEAHVQQSAVSDQSLSSDAQERMKRFLSEN